MLEAAFGVDRAVGALMNVLPPNTIVVYASDNGYLWGEHGLRFKEQPHDESIKIPLIIRALDGGYEPRAAANDLVANVDLRPTLTRAAGVQMLTRADGINLGRVDYAPRNSVVLEHLQSSKSLVPSYCGIREVGWMFARYAGGRELLFDLTSDPNQSVNLAGDPRFRAERDRLLAETRLACDPVPPGYVW